MSAHAFLPPSGAGYWVSCAAWPLMNATYPQDDTDESLEGTAAHWCWEPQLLDACLPLPAVGTVAPNGVIVTDEMLDGAEEYIGTIDQALRQYGMARADLHVEERIAIGAIHGQNWGTPDTWFFAERAAVLEIFDYKFGHDPVEAFENWQCIDYAAGIIDKLVAERAHWSAAAVQNWRDSVRVRITVVQPRNYITGRCEPWEISGAQLWPFWQRLRLAASAGMEYPPMATPGTTKQCTHCPGSHACGPLQAQGYQAVHFARRTIPAPLDAGALGAELATLQENAALLQARIAGLEADADARLRRGTAVPGYALESTKGRESWRAPPDKVLALGSLFAVNLAKPALLTPNQARAAGIPADVVATVTGTASGMRLARVSQKSLTKAFGPASK